VLGKLHGDKLRQWMACRASCGNGDTGGVRVVEDAGGATAYALGRSLVVVSPEAATGRWVIEDRSSGRSTVIGTAATFERADKRARKFFDVPF
jgi:hypothetical protein